MDLEKLKATASAVKQWGNCCDSWTDNSEDTACCVVGHIDKETGERYPVVTVDCELYYSPDSDKLAHFYATANPTAIIELIARLEKAEKLLLFMRSKWEMNKEIEGHVVLVNAHATEVIEWMREVDKLLES